MKKFLVIALAAVFATPAFATKARLLALGEDTIGSQYISDTRNVFLNAAHVNNHKNLVVTEWGSDGANNTKLDSDSNAYAEGGLFHAWNNLVIGAYFGGETQQSYEARQILNVSNREVHQDNQVDLFVGGDAGVQWGANLTHSTGEKDDGDIKDDSLSARLGVIADRVEGFANISLVNKFEGDLNASGTDEEFDGKLGYEIGGSYDVGAGKVFAFWRHAGWEQESDVAFGAGGSYVGEAEVTTNRYILGYGSEKRVSGKASLFWKVSYVRNTRALETEDDGDADLNDLRVPVTVALEYDAASWLVLRGSVTQNLYSEADNEYDDGLSALINNGLTNVYPEGKRTVRNSTNVNAGATLKFGDLSVDGLLGLNGGTSTAESGNFGTDDLLARVAMTYRF